MVAKMRRGRSEPPSESLVDKGQKRCLWIIGGPEQKSTGSAIQMPPPNPP